MSSLRELHPGTGIGPSAGTLKPIVDVVAIHGLNPLGSEDHAIDTWQHKTSENLWLRDRIPYKKPDARVFLYEYNSSPVFGTSQDRFMYEANLFLESLRLERRDDSKRPLVLLGHSLGGILIKQALVNAYNDPKYRDIQEATYGLIFFGTPHGGPGNDWKTVFGKTCVRIVQSTPGKSSNDIMEALKKGSLFSDALQLQWRHQLSCYKIVTFYEGIGGVVPRESACLGLTGDHESQLKIEAKHEDMCRFDPKSAMDEKNYKFVEGNVVELCEHAARQLGSPIYKYAMDPKAKELDLQIGRLRLADGASFDSILNQHEALCMDQTRVQLLQELQEWLSSPQSPILWLSGMAGTGKSTIARTMAHRLYAHHRLAGSFFFRRAGNLSKAGNFVSTLAYQLATIPQPSTSLSFKELIGEAILNHGEVLAQGLRRQWKELIVGPLSRIESSQRLALTFVVDALDECGSEDNIRLILQLFIELKEIKNLDLSVLITSRPETTLLRGLQDISGIMHRRLDLRDIPRHIVEQDLYVYMKRKLGKIKSYGRSDWLSEKDLVSLVQKADCLFIYAATVCLFIEKSSYDIPEDCVSSILQSRPTGGGDTAAIDDMYTQVLSSALATRGQRKETTERLTIRFKDVVGSLVAFLKMLSITALSDLLSMKVETVRLTLGPLESVLNIPSDAEQPIRLIHPSFRDFLLDKARCRDERFHVDRETAHADIAIRCLDVLRRCLRKNVCNLESPDSSPQQVSEDVLNHSLPEHVQYACQYWIEHLDCASPHQRIQLGLCDDGEIHNFFKEKFLYWLEAMSIMGKMPQTVLMMNTLSAMLELNEHPTLRVTVKDAQRYLLSNIDIVQKAPLQTYASALVFSPRESQIRNENLAHYPTWFKYGPDVQNNWGNVLQTLQGHDEVIAIAFSFDGKYLASLSTRYETLLWDTTTGTLHSTLSEGIYFDYFGPSPHCFTFSHNGQLVSVSSKHEARVLDPVTGATCHTLVHDEHWNITAIAFASDGTLAISYQGTPTQTRIYKAGALSTSIETQYGVYALSFMSERTLALLHSRGSRYDHSNFVRLLEGELLLYDPETHAERRIPIGFFTSVSFSPNDQLAAYNSEDNVAHVYDLKSGSCQTYKAARGHLISCLAFSINQKGIFFGYSDGWIYYVDLESRTETFIWICSNPIKCIAHSPDGRLAIASKYSREIQLLEVGSDPSSHKGDLAITSASTRGRMLRSWLQRPLLERAPMIPNRPIRHIVFSHDGKQITYADGKNICVLDPATLSERRVYRSEGVLSLTINGNYLAAGHFTGQLGVCDAASGRLVIWWNGHSKPVMALAFSPDSSTLVSVDSEGNAKFWDSKMWVLQHTLLVRAVESTSFSQSGKRVAFVDTCSLEIWDAEQYICLHNNQVRFHYVDLYANRIYVFADEAYIDTTRGRVQLDRTYDDPPNERYLLEKSKSDRPEVDRKWLKVEEARWRVYDGWLYHDGQRMLWLPHDFRPTCMAIYGDSLVLGHRSGKITFFEGNTDGSTPEQAHGASAPGKGLQARDRVQRYFHRLGKSAGKHKD